MCKQFLTNELKLSNKTYYKKLLDNYKTNIKKTWSVINTTLNLKSCLKKKKHLIS